MKDKPKVLVGCPVSRYKDYILYDWIEYVKTQLTYDNYDIFLSDNSPDFCHAIKLSTIDGITVRRCKQNNDSNRFYMARSNEQLRKYAEKNGYDYLLNLECDIIPPPDIIERLIAHEKQVVNAPYFTGDSFWRVLMIQGAFEVIPNNYKALTLNQETGFLMMDGSLKRVYAAGTGCTMLKRSVFTKLKFRVAKNNEGHADSFLYLDLHKMGIPVYLDTSLILKHYNSPELWTQLKNNSNGKR